MSTELVHQVRVNPDKNSTVIEMSQNGVVTPGGLADTRTTLQSMQKKDCCDYIVPPEKQPNCWQKLTPCQKTTICCGSVVAVGGGTIGTLIGTGVVSSSGGGLIAVIVIGVCCSIKLAIGGVFCYKKFSSQNEQ